MLVTARIPGYGLQFRAIEESLQRYLPSIAVSERKNCIDLPLAYKTDGDWFCTIGGKNKTPAQIFAYGDSHAYRLLPALEKLSAEGDMKILFASGSGCLPLLGVKVERGNDWLEKYNCPKLNDRIFEYVKNNNIKNVFLISRWTYYGKSNVGPAKGNTLRLSEKEAADTGNIRGSWYDYGIENTINKYKGIGVNLYIFEDNPTQIYDPKDALKKVRRQFDDVSINKWAVSKDAHKNQQAYFSNKFGSINNKSATVVNFDELLCGDDICPLVTDGKFIYTDHDHLSISGAMLIYPAIKKILPRLRNVAF